MDNALVPEDIAVREVVESSSQNLQLLPVFKDKKTGAPKQQNVLEEDQYVEVSFFSK